MKRPYEVMRKFLRNYVDDLLMMAGGVCIVVGIGMWSIPAAWIASGIELIGLAVLIGARDAAT